MQSFLPYHNLFSRRQFGRSIHSGDERHREIENAVRAKFGFPLVGERWISETMLFRVVQQLFAPAEVVHHYRGEELAGLELDIWVPELKLGIEYQGAQHYQPVAHWGGEEGLAKRRANDRRKKRICHELGYALVEFMHTEELSESLVASKLKRFLRRESTQSSGRER